MGDRGNIFFVDAHGKQLGGMYMYSHWGGSTMWSVVRAALERGRERWGDRQYLARIIFCELVRDSVLDTTGFGLGTSIGDNGHAIVRVDDGAQRVSFHVPGKERSAADHGVASWTYDEYLSAPAAAIERAFLGDDEDDDEPVLPKATAKPKSKSRPKPGAKPPAKTSKKPAKKSKKSKQ